MVPFIILLIVNVTLVFSILKPTKLNSSAKNRRKGTSVFIIVLTFLFIVMSLPSAIGGGYFLKELFANPNENYLFLMNNITFSYHAFNFFIFGVVNRRLQSCFKAMVLRQPNLAIQQSTTLNF